MFNRSEFQSAVLNLGVFDHSGVFLEELVNVPGACDVHMNGNLQYFIDAYTAGIEAIKRGLVGAAEYVARRLPINVPKAFIENILRRVKYSIYDPGDYTNLINIVKRYSDT